jgi:hypothetical protein
LQRAVATLRHFGAINAADEQITSEPSYLRRELVKESGIAQESSQRTPLDPTQVWIDAIDAREDAV